MTSKVSSASSVKGTRASTVAGVVQALRPAAASSMKDQDSMSALERLQHIRVETSYLESIVERERHIAPLYEKHDVEARAFFSRLSAVLKNQLSKKHPHSKETTTPLSRTVLLENALLLLSEGQRIVGNTPSQGLGSEYPGLHRKFLVDAINHLRALTTYADSSIPLPSQINYEVLRDQVDHHLEDFNYFISTGIHDYVREGANEGVCYSSVVPNVGEQSRAGQQPQQQAPASGERRAPISIMSATLLDVCVGFSGSAPTVLFDHLGKVATKVEARLRDAADLLSKIVPKDKTENDRNTNQARCFEKMFQTIRDVQSQREKLSSAWITEEKTIFEKLLSNNYDLASLAALKRMKIQELKDRILKLYYVVVADCLPFASPQYHRRHTLTYSLPCSVRIGLRIYNPAAERFVLFPNLNPHFQYLLQKHRADAQEIDFLVPSSDFIWFSFDEVPQMVRSHFCALESSEALLRCAPSPEMALEEPKELGAYFIMRGGERICRSLLMQRSNVPLNITREMFCNQGPGFSSKAVVFRSKRLSGLTTVNYFYYTNTGNIVVSFARKVVWHIPLTLLMFSCYPLTLSLPSLYQQLTLGVTNSSAQYVARVEALLEHHRNASYGSLTHYLDYLTVIGVMYRQYQQQHPTMFRFLPDLGQGMTCHHDAWYGLFMLRRHILPHLNADVPTPSLKVGERDVSRWLSEELQQELLRKFHVLCAVTRQLHAFVDGSLEHQGNDVPAYQEIFGEAELMVGAFEVCLNKYMRAWIYRLAHTIQPALCKKLQTSTLLTPKDMEVPLTQVRSYVTTTTKFNADALLSLHKLLTSGNLLLDREEDFYTPQSSGWIVMAERLNFFRFFEQFRCVHRGKTIADMRSSDVRRFPCEAYGFICMVHSPDGEDCGVLNHLCTGTIISGSSTFSNSVSDIPSIARDFVKECFSLIPFSAAVSDRLLNTVPVWVEGCIIGYVRETEADNCVHLLRQKRQYSDQNSFRAEGLLKREFQDVLKLLEVVYVPSCKSKEAPGVYVFSGRGRLMRGILALEEAPALLSEKSSHSSLVGLPIEFIGTWEQTRLNIAAAPSDLCDCLQIQRTCSYMDIGSNIVSLTSTTIPFFEHNCSPRNLFQCGLSKQSSGTQIAALGWRRDAKLFRTYCPQRYICRTLPMDYFGLDDFSLGVNAVVAILCYTGYDLDDAVIVNRTATERGMLNAGVTVAKVVTATGKHTAGSREDCVFVFHNQLTSGSRFAHELEDNGLPPRRANVANVNTIRDSSVPALLDESPVYCVAQRFKRVDPLTETTQFEYTRHSIVRWKHFDKAEAAWVHSVVPLTYDGPDVTSALIVFRIPRPPTVGDKFSSRHGQKGTLPLLVPSIDLPFCGMSGITPDVIINPHAFPSRMTVGMVLEMMAAKLGAVMGRFFDFSPWKVVDGAPRSVEELGQALAERGFHRYGRETLYCGVSGRAMEAQVFMGVCGYQRLRHMVNDKWQARSRTDMYTHRAVTKTGQPVKGRKRHGGVRVGEMERDGLLSHGVSEVVIDRLLKVSDNTKAFICAECGSLVSIFERHTTRLSSWKTCNFCGAGEDENSDTIRLIDVPQVFKLWAFELTGLGVRVTVNHR